MKICQVFALVCLFGSAGPAVEQGSALEAEGLIAVKAARIYTGDGAEIQGGLLIIRDGRIELAGTNLEIPGGAAVYDPGEGYCLTPGLIDAASTAGIISSRSWAEHSSEVIPQMSNMDALDLESKDFDRLARTGVTTVYVTPDPASIIGCQGAVVKTGGPGKDRIVKDRAGVKATLGPEGWRRGQRNETPRGDSVTFMTRRPTTRMGMAWVFRKAFYDAMAYREARSRSAPDRPDPDPAMEVLVRILEGKVPLRIQAREDIDIWSAIRFGREFGFKFVLEEGIEAYKCIPELKEYGVPVIFGPVFVQLEGPRAMSGEDLRPCLNTAGMLAEAGIPLALTAGDLDGESALPYQACFAIRHGLPFEAAMTATTSVPAGILGVADRVGTLKPGMDADLVLWKGKPFSPASRPVLVMIRGEVVHRDEELSPRQ